MLVSTCLSKSVLRVAANTCAAMRENVAYFPAYEIITGPHSGGAYYEDDLRSVNEKGVNHVMRTSSVIFWPMSRTFPAVANTRRRATQAGNSNP